MSTSQLKLSAARVAGRPTLAAPRPATRVSAVSRRSTVKVQAIGGGPPQPSENKVTKKITREEEPQEYWRSNAETEGNVFKDPLAIIGVVAIFFPFVLLLIGGATGLIDFSVYK